MQQKSFYNDRNYQSGNNYYGQLPKE